MCNRGGGGGGVGSGVVVGRGGVGSLGAETAFARADSPTFPQITLPNYQMNILIDSCFFGMIFTEPRGHKKTCAHDERTWFMCKIFSPPQNITPTSKLSVFPMMALFASRGSVFLSMNCASLSMTLWFTRASLSPPPHVILRPFLHRGEG